MKTKNQKLVQKAKLKSAVIELKMLDKNITHMLGSERYRYDPRIEIMRGRERALKRQFKL